MHIRRLSGCCLLSLAAAVLSAQSPAPARPAAGTPVPPSEVFGRLLTSAETQLVSAVEAMPESKFDFAPAATMGEYAGVRTLAQEVKHITEANLVYFHDPSMPPADRAQVEGLKSRTEIIGALKSSFTQAHAFVDQITPANAFIATPNGATRAGMAAGGIAHLMDHYGQIVEYLRMNGVVPPASRKASM